MLWYFTYSPYFVFVVVYLIPLHVDQIDPFLCSLTDGDGGGATGAAVDNDDDGGYDDGEGATTATVTAKARRCCA